MIIITRATSQKSNFIFKYIIIIFKYIIITRVSSPKSNFIIEIYQENLNKVTYTINDNMVKKVI